jgi:hypothetical protein
MTSNGRGHTLESKVQRLRGEVTDDVGRVTTPEGQNTFFPGCAAEALNDTIVTLGKTSRLRSTWLARPANCRWYLEHFILILDEELDSLDGGCHVSHNVPSGAIGQNIPAAVYIPISLNLTRTKGRHGRTVGEGNRTLATAAETPPTTQKVSSEKISTKGPD